MRKQTVISVNLDGLNKLTKDCKNTHARVGVLAGDNIRPGGADVSNYDLALIHEFGTLDGKIPARSWARMPIESNGKELVRFAEKNSDLLLKDGNVKAFFDKIGAWGLGIIRQAFATQGFGKWADNAPSTIAAKGGKDSPLIHTRAFEKSMSWDVQQK
jgi:hypothetical protein